MQFFKKNILLCSILCSSSWGYANNNDLVGLWRNVDDKTGFSKGIVEIKKDNNGLYSGKVIEIIPRPDYTPKTHCYQCPAPYTNQPILGLQVLSNMKADPNKPREYQGGTILDPVSGKIYKSRIKLNSTGSRLTMRGFIGFEIIGRSQTWIRHNP